MSEIDISPHRKLSDIYGEFRKYAKEEAKKLKKDRGVPTARDQVDDCVRFWDGYHQAASSKSHREFHQTFIVVCRACRERLPKECPMVERRGVWYEGAQKFMDEIPFLCPSCGEDPRYGGVSQSGPTIIDDWKPYIDCTAAPNAPGARYIPEAGGHLIESYAHAREFARLNGLRIKPGWTHGRSAR